MKPGQMDFHLDEPAWSVLERERPYKPFAVRAGGRVIDFIPAPDVPAGVLLQVAADWRLFLGYCTVNSTDLSQADFPWWKAEHMLRLYRRHYGLNPDPERDRQLFAMLDKEEYRDAAETDLHQVYGADLGELWRGRRWRTLLGLLERLGRSTFYCEVLSQDEELAKRVLNRKRKLGEDHKTAPTRRMSEFTTDTELLTIVADRLGELIAVTAGGKARPPKALPRPKTALQKLRDQGDQLHVQFTLDRIFGLVDAKGNPTTPKKARQNGQT